MSECIHSWYTLSSIEVTKSNISKIIYSWACNWNLVSDLHLVFWEKQFCVYKGAVHSKTHKLWKRGGGKMSYQKW